MISNEQIAQAKAELPYPQYRAWWAEHVMQRPYRKTWKSRAVKPPPGVIDAQEQEG